MLFRRNNLHTILFQNVLVVCAVITVTGKAAELPYKCDYYILMPEENDYCTLKNGKRMHNRKNKL